MIDRVRERLEAFEQSADVMPLETKGFRQAVRQLVVVASSSRGGSTVLADMLRRTPQMLHFVAEVNPFFRLAGLTYPDRESEALDAEDGPAVETLEAQLARECGQLATAPSSQVELRGYAWHLARRLVMQWPLQEPLSTEDVLGCLPSAAPRERFYVLLLQNLRRLRPHINPFYYDLPPTLVEEYFPGLDVPQGPPAHDLIEEPPFVTPPAWRRASAADWAARPLIIKTPSNAYRLRFLRAFFPNARLRVLHLTRNAAASINGLVDGWLSRGFFSHAVDVPLQIEGYSDRCAWGNRWWNFDLPPAWREWSGRPLAEVCGFQWLSAHEAVLRYVEESGADYLRVRFEDVVEGPQMRMAAFERMADWLGIGMDEALREVAREDMPPLMATSWPSLRRWMQKAELLKDVLERQHIREMMERLGYEEDRDTWL